MVKVLDIIARLEAILQPQSFHDYGPNGLQVPGRAETDRVVTGVSATKALLTRAAELQAGLVLVHHGLFWDGDPPGLSPIQAERLRVLFVHDIALAAYHLPLDAHPEHGNNALLAEAIGADGHEPFGELGRVATFGGDGLAPEELLARVHEATGREPLLQGAGPQRIRRVGILTGSGASMLPQAVADGLDAFITGEPREHVMADATESTIHFVAAGHYASETFGVRRLGDLLADEYGIEHVFVDLPNPV